MNENDKPALHLLNGSEITFEMLGQLFAKLTGREPTAEEIEEARREWDRLENEDSQV